MKKLLALVLSVALALGVAPFAFAEGETFELALVTDIGTIDDKSFNQGAWEGLVQYAEENNLSHKYYQPLEKSTDAYLDQIELAVNAGAKVIVTPGFLFEEPIYIAQDMYPDVHFILLDGEPHNADYSEYRTNENVAAILYAEDQSGFLAGYAVVKGGYTNLGFMGGMAVPAVIRFGYGFLQGAEYAAKEMGIEEITVNYHYTGSFDATPEAQTLASGWYNDGVEVIFGCGGSVGNSVMAAAEAMENKWGRRRGQGSERRVRNRHHFRHQGPGRLRLPDPAAVLCRRVPGRADHGQGRFQRGRRAPDGNDQNRRLYPGRL